MFRRRTKYQIRLVEESGSSETREIRVKKPYEPNKIIRIMDSPLLGGWKWYKVVAVDNDKKQISASRLSPEQESGWALNALLSAPI